MDKYYTPEIEEFHIGFEYEENCEYGEYPDQYDEWECKTIDFAIEINEIEKALEISRIRVKYLDKEDIESCGFEDDKKDCTLWYRFTKNGTTIIAPKSLGGGENVCYLISIWGERAKHYSEGAEEPECMFGGFIKNLSELKVLLKQLGIDE